MHVAIAVSRTGAEERRLLDAATAAGCSAGLYSPDECLAQAPGWPADTVVLNRVLGFTQALALAHLLEASGIPTFNRATVIHTCGNKAATTARLQAAGVPVPPTRVAFSRDTALAAVEELGYPVVVKPVVGSWGRLLAKVNDRDAAEGVLSHQEASPSATRTVYYLQRFVGPDVRDLRVLVVGDRVVCAVERRAEHWIRNLTRHQTPHPVRPSAQLRSCALAAAAAVGGGALGVDILEDPDGCLHVLEVNHRPEFRWTQQAAEQDIAVAVVDWLLEQK